MASNMRVSIYNYEHIKSLMVIEQKVFCVVKSEENTFKSLHYIYQSLTEQLINTTLPKIRKIKYKAGIIPLLYYYQKNQ